MRILFLDDDANRFDLFRQLTIGCVVDWAKTADEAIELLKANNYDGAFLDHDLDDGAYVGKPKEKTGQDVARWIAGNATLPPSSIIIHSLNQAGAKAMKEILADANIPSALFPFAWKAAAYNGKNLVLKAKS
jgi:CheY-like chemotaxis protein